MKNAPQTKANVDLLNGGIIEDRREWTLNEYVQI